MHIHEDDAPRARQQPDLAVRDERLELGRPELDGPAFTPDPQDARRALEGHEHDADARVAGLAQVGVRLDARARLVEVPEGSGRQDAEALVAFGRDVDVPVASERRGAHPEHLLGEDPGVEGLRDGFVEDAHCGGGRGAAVLPAARVLCREAWRGTGVLGSPVWEWLGERR